MFEIISALGILAALYLVFASHCYCRRCARPIRFWQDATRDPYGKPTRHKKCG